MKLIILLISFGFLNAHAATAHEKDLMNCKISDANHLTSHLRIFQSKGGYEYEASSCQGLGHATCMPYESQGAISRRMVEGTIGHDAPSGLYYSDTVDVRHFFGEYHFGDKSGPSLIFPDENCTFSNGERRDIAARGELGDGIFGTCAHPDPIGYLRIAKERANGSASSRCAPLTAHRISDFEVFGECIQESYTAVARAIYRCEPVALADPQVIICESDGTSTPAKLEFQSFGPGQEEALVMEYQGRNVLIDPLAVFNHMGLILFRGQNGIAFNAYEYSDTFYVTVPAFGGEPLVTARGSCRPKD